VLEVYGLDIPWQSRMYHQGQDDTGVFVDTRRTKESKKLYKVIIASAKLVHQLAWATADKGQPRKEVVCVRDHQNIRENLFRFLGENRSRGRRW
jgi:hypothetical protein